MIDATDRTGPEFDLPPGVALKDASVNVKDISPVLQSFLIVAGLVHMNLFNELLIVTSGKDSQHVASSKHDKGEAVDLRITSVPERYQPAFLLVLRVLCARFLLAMFDETYAPNMGHVHIEIAG